MPAQSFINAPAANPPEPPRPIVRIALAHVAGMAVGMALPFPWWVWGWLVAVPLLASFAFLLRSRRIRGAAPPEGGLLLVAVLGLGALFGSGLERADRAALAAIPPWANEQTVRAEGTLSEEPRLVSGGVEFVLRDVSLASMQAGGRSGAFMGKMALTLRDARPQALPLPGQRVRAFGRFHRADAPQSTPAPFNAWRYWRSRGIFAKLSVGAPGDVLLGPAPATPYASFLSGLRGCRQWMNQNLAAQLSPATQPLAYALLIGDTAQVDPELRDAFNRTGLAHLLSVSGLHTGFILLLLVGMTRLLWLSPRAGGWLAIFGLFAYTALTGFYPPVVRAATMGAFLLFGMALGRFVTPLASLAAAAWLTLLADPRNILRLDWQLSYACALAIMLLAPPLFELFTAVPAPPPRIQLPSQPSRWRAFINRYFFLPLSVTLAVQCGLAPLQIFYFQRLNPASFISNMLVVPLSFFAVVGSLLTSLAGGIPWLGGLSGISTDFVLRFLIGAVRWCDHLPLMTFSMLPWPVWITGLYLAILLGGSGILTGRDRALRLDRRQRNAIFFAMLLAVALILIAPLVSRRPSGLLDFYMLNVGQGDGLVVRFPNGRVMTIDGGPHSPADQGRFTIGPFLQSLGVTRIDCMVATHADADHIGGLPWLIDHFEVGAIVTGSDLSDAAIYKDLLAAIDRRRVPAIHAMAGESLQGFGGVKVQLLGPLPGRDNNDASVAMLINDDEVQILATGDIESPGEHDLLAHHALSDIEILKVGHHGSKSSTSEAMLEVTRPEIALVSVGKRNRYGHPAPEVMQRLTDEGAETFRTDTDGTIRVRTDGRMIEVYRFAGY